MKLQTTLLAMTLAACAWGAPVTGKWKMAANAPDGNTHNVDLVVKEEGGKLTATIESERGSMPVQEVAYKDDELTFKLVLDFGPIPFKLKVDGDTLKGAMTLPDGSSGTVTGKRDGAAAAVAAAPVSATGKWKISAKDGEGNVIKATIELQQAGEGLTGQLTMENGDAVGITDGKAAGAEISFKIPSPDGIFEVTGTVAGNEVKGTYKTPNGAKGTFSGTK